MGQYYRPIMQKVDSNKVIVYNRNINGEYTMAKLMEHSYINNPLMNTICKMLYKTKQRVAWVGDYAEDDELKELKIPLSTNKIWGQSIKGVGLKEKPFVYKNKYLVNHTKKQYIDFSLYIGTFIYEVSTDFIIHPLSLLTAVGNGRGGGDFNGENEELVGTWAWDVIEITDCKPSGYTHLNEIFIEKY